jgi:hypothetical protein
VTVLAVTNFNQYVGHRLVAASGGKHDDSVSRETEALIAEVLEVYPEKAKKDRAKHLASTTFPSNNPRSASRPTASPCRA